MNDCDFNKMQTKAGDMFRDLQVGDTVPMVTFDGTGTLELRLVARGAEQI